MADPISAFGGIVAFNRPIDAETADGLTKLFLEVIIAPGADEAALDILSKKANLRILLSGSMPDPRQDSWTAKTVAGGLLVQERDNGLASADDLKTVIEDNSGAEFSAFAGRTMQEYDKPGREAAEAANNEIVILDEAEVARWKEAAQPVIDNWIAEMNEKGIDGADLYERAQALMEQYTTQ